MCTLRRSFLALCALLLLASCSRTEGLAAEEVLSRAARAGRDLQSAEFALQAAFEKASALSGGTSGTLQAAGRMHQGGQQLQFSINGNGQTGESGTPGSYSWAVGGDVIVAGEDEVYIALRELTTNPPDALFPAMVIPSLVNQWWQLPARGSGSHTPVTPNPQLLNMQTEVVDVTRDHGQTMVNGHASYHYDVAINRDKLFTFLEQVARERGQEFDPSAAKALTENVDATGELWIDAETFFMQGIQWTIASKDPVNPQRLQFQLTLTSFNAAQPIEPPSPVQQLPVHSFDGLIPTLPLP